MVIGSWACYMNSTGRWQQKWKKQEYDTATALVLLGEFLKKWHSFMESLLCAYAQSGDGRDGHYCPCKSNTFRLFTTMGYMN